MDTISASPETLTENRKAFRHRPGYFFRSELGDGAAEFYRDQGYLVLVDALSEAEVDALCGETVSICRGQRGMISGREAMISDEEVVSLSDDEVLARILCIHQPHKISDAMHQALAHPGIVDVLTRVIGPNVKCMQSMLFVKSAGKPGQAWHQDEDYIPTRDRSLVGAWISLDHATIENGCLWVIPGSHKPGVLWPQYPHDDPRFDCASMSYDFPYEDERDSVPVEVPRGAIVFFNGYLLHRSLPNQAQSGFRRALVNHYMSAESFLPWRHEEGIPMAKQDYRDIVMVAGTDPFAWKGTDEITKPHIRPAGEGGCGDGRLSLEEYKKKQAVS